MLLYHCHGICYEVQRKKKKLWRPKKEDKLSANHRTGEPETTREKWANTHTKSNNGIREQLGNKNNKQIKKGVM
jgi:hypothetical protein